MMLTTNTGQPIRGGYTSQNAATWDQVETWTPNTEYQLSDFRGVKEQGMVIIFESNVAKDCKRSFLKKNDLTNQLRNTEKTFRGWNIRARVC